MSLSKDTARLGQGAPVKTKEASQVPPSSTTTAAFPSAAKEQKHARDKDKDRDREKDTGLVGSGVSGAGPAKDPGSPEPKKVKLESGSSSTPADRSTPKAGMTF